MARERSNFGEALSEPNFPSPSSSEQDHPNLDHRDSQLAKRRERKREVHYLFSVKH